MYEVDSSVLKITKEFAKSHSLNLLVADCETDLIAISNLFIITDINKLTNATFDYIRGFVSEGLFDEEMIISYTEPKSELAIAHSRYFEIKPNLSIEYLEEILPQRIMTRANSELREVE